MRKGSSSTCNGSAPVVCGWKGSGACAGAGGVTRGRSISGALTATPRWRRQAKPIAPKAARPSAPANNHGHHAPPSSRGLPSMGAEAIDGEGCPNGAEGAGTGTSLSGASAECVAIASGVAARRGGVGVAVGVGRGDATTGGGATVGVTMGGGGGGSSVARGVGVGTERDSGTSGATGPCRSGCGCVCDGTGKRKSLTEAPAALAGAASRSTEIRAK